MAVTRRAVLKGLLAGGVAGIGAPTAYGFLYARRSLAVTHATVPVIGLPESLAGIRIGMLTDIHRSQWVSGEDVARAATTLLAERPDLIVLGGDYVTWGDRAYVGPAAEALAGLSAPLGVFGIIGNHDDDHDMPAALARQGVEVLKDARTSLTVRGETIDLVGIRFWTKRADHIRAVVGQPRGTTILLAHDPRRIAEAASLDIPLVLSGHTHGGQIVLPVLGAIAAQKFPLVAGLGRRHRTTIFVSRGIGTVYVPVRLNCPPEVAMLTLARAPDKPSALDVPAAV